MKVNILLTKKVPGAQRVEWPEVPEWVWAYYEELDACYTYLRIDLGYNSAITFQGSVSSTTGACSRVYNLSTRKLVYESTADGPWLIKEPDRLVPLTVEEVAEKFAAKEWVGIKILPDLEPYFYASPKDWLLLNHTISGKILALNTRTLEVVKVAEVVE